MYPFPVWRRVPFVALVIVVSVLAFAPATTQGTANVRVAAVSVPSIVTHLYIAISSIQFHKEGFLFQPNSTGWTSVSQAFPIIDLLSQTSQSLPQTATSAAIHSGRYDRIAISFTNATIIVAGQTKHASAPPPLQADVTLRVSPNGIGDLLFVVAFDYTTFYTTLGSNQQPTLSFTLVRVSAT